MGQTVRPIITSGTVAAGGVLISAVDGTAFIDVNTSKTGAADFSTAILAAVANNDVIELTSKTNGKKIYGYAKAAGSAETLTEELLTSFINVVQYPFETFEVSGSDITSAINTTGWAYSIQFLPSPPFKLYKIISTGYVLNSGTAPKFQLANTPVSDDASLYITKGSGVAQYKTAKSDTSLITVWVGNNVATNFSLTGTSVKQVLTPSASGVTLTNTIGGTTYNFAVKDSAFTYNDSAGYDYRIISSTAYGKLIATQSPTSGTLHIATKDGEAMFFHDSIDFSAYAGTDVGSTKYLFVFYDNAGKSAQAYAGAVGGGEALGAEINTGTLTAGTLYKITATEVNHFGTGLEVDDYFTSAGTETCDANNKVKALTDIAATGLHLMSAKNGTTRNMKSVESGFNPNTITRVNIYRAY